jgi:hypothetical protein
MADHVQQWRILLYFLFTIFASFFQLCSLQIHPDPPTIFDEYLASLTDEPLLSLDKLFLQLLMRMAQQQGVHPSPEWVGPAAMDRFSRMSLAELARHEPLSVAFQYDAGWKWRKYSLLLGGDTLLHLLVNRMMADTLQVLAEKGLFQYMDLSLRGQDGRTARTCLLRRKNRYQDPLFNQQKDQCLALLEQARQDQRQMWKPVVDAALDAPLIPDLTNMVFEYLFAEEAPLKPLEVIVVED